MAKTKKFPTDPGPKASEAQLQKYYAGCNDVAVHNQAVQAEKDRKKKIRDNAKALKQGKVKPRATKVKSKR